MAPRAWLTTVTAATGCALVVASACVAPVRSTATARLSPEQIAELWQEPQDITTRDLFWGPWGKTFAPATDRPFKVVAEKTIGFSPGFTVVDADGGEWSVKQGAESQTEVAVSRLLSAIGYHQPPVYYVAEWSKAGGTGPAQQGGSRFRPKGVAGLHDKGSWSWQENPFVGTPAYQGLLATLMLVNSTDLKNENNALYEVNREDRSNGPHRWYVVRDLGASLGETGRIDPRRGDPFLFTRTPFLLGMQDGFVRFNYRGRHRELVDHHITSADLRWMARLLGRLTDKQMRDAFRAAGYGSGASETYVRRLREKVAEARSMAS